MNNEEKLSMLRESFYNNGGTPDSERVVVFFNRWADAIVEINFKSCLVQYTKEIDQVDFTLTLEDNADVHIKLPLLPYASKEVDTIMDMFDYEIWIPGLRDPYVKNTSTISDLRRYLGDNESRKDEFGSVL